MQPGAKTLSQKSFQWEDNLILGKPKCHRLELQASKIYNKTSVTIGCLLFFVKCLKNGILNEVNSFNLGFSRRSQKNIEMPRRWQMQRVNFSELKMSI